MQLLLYYWVKMLRTTYLASLSLSFITCEMGIIAHVRQLSKAQWPFLTTDFLGL